jgi:hypothetical protein
LLVLQDLQAFKACPVRWVTVALMVFLGGQVCVVREVTTVECVLLHFQERRDPPVTQEYQV